MLGLRDTNTTLAGRVLDAGGLAPRADAFVSAWSTNGQWISAIADRQRHLQPADRPG